MNYVNGLLTVKIGRQMADWEKHELIMKFRETFKSSNIEIIGSGVNLHGESTTVRSF